MKSVKSQSALGRRVAVGAVIGLAATTFSLGAAGSADAVTTIDLQGTVTGLNGAAVPNVDVVVFDATTGHYIDDIDTDGSGHYEFDSLTSGSVKVEFADDDGFAYDDPAFYLTRWYGGSRYQGGATPVAVVADSGATLNFAMTAAPMITGTVAAEDGHTFTDGFDLNVLNSDLDWASYRWAGSPDGKSFKIATEAGTYRVAGYGWDDPTVTAPEIVYVAKWWKSGDTPTEATPITVAAGQTVTGIDIRLTDKLVARQAPQVNGVAAIGRTLTATSGTWSRNAGTDFSFTWMRGATVLGTGATYTPTAADFGQRLSVVVRALNGGNAGQAASAQTDPVRWPADTKGKAKAMSGRKVGFSVKLVSAKQSPVKGKVVVMRGTKVVHKAVKLVNGKAVIVLKNQPKGTQTYTVVYKGNSLLSKSTKNFTVRVHS